MLSLQSTDWHKSWTQWLTLATLTPGGQIPEGLLQVLGQAELYSKTLFQNKTTPNLCEERGQARLYPCSYATPVWTAHVRLSGIFLFLKLHETTVC